ncbi:MAG TPA: hypothetical protein VFL13_00025 [Candidatus Baltobacteraceae bacterium]|nr:hypothetical protein [Candidatus Baltobacteraceae bacterium]
MSNFRLAPAAVLLVLATACAPPPKPLSPTQAIEAKELAAVDALHLRTKYKDIVMGDDVKGTTLVVYADRNNVDSMDEQAEDAMVGDTLVRWKAIWSANHPHKHAKLVVSVRDFYASQIVAQSTQV